MSQLQTTDQVTERAVRNSTDSIQDSNATQFLTRQRQTQTNVLKWCSEGTSFNANTARLLVARQVTEREVTTPVEADPIFQRKASDCDNRWTSVVSSMLQSGWPASTMMIILPNSNRNRTADRGVRQDFSNFKRQFLGQLSTDETGGMMTQRHSLPLFSSRMVKAQGVKILLDAGREREKGPHGDPTV